MLVIMQKEEKQLIRKINTGAGVLDVYLITLAVNPANQLEIFSANELMQKARRKSCPMIVGLCRGYEEALEMVQYFAQKTYESTGTGAVRKWLEKEIEGGR